MSELIQIYKEIPKQKEPIKEFSKEEILKNVNINKSNIITHSYACSLLLRSNKKIYINNKQILKQLYYLPPTKGITTIVKVGVNPSLSYLPDDIKKRSYTYLQKLGWKISVRQSPQDFFKYQQVTYVLTPLNSNSIDYRKIPDNHSIEHDMKNQQIRLVGKNTSILGATDWIDIQPSKKENENKPPESPYDTKGLQEWAYRYEQSLIYPPLRAKKTDKEMEIKEILIGVTEMGEFVCMPHTKDAPIITISGSRGYGKSFLEDNLEGGFYYKYNYDIFNFNDIKGDTQTRCLRWDEKDPFYKDLEAFGENTVPLPYIYLTPTIEGLKDEQVLYKDEVGFKISLSFKDLMLDPNLMKYNKDWKLTDKSKKYIHDLIFDDDGKERENGLLNAKNLNDVSIVLDTFLPKKNDQLNSSLFNLFKDIWHKQVLDISSGITSYWRIERGNKKATYSAWNVCLMARLIPSFITTHIRNESYFGIWIKHILEDVFEFVRTSGYDRYLMLCGDELVQLLRDKDIKSIIDKIIREGRTDKVGMISVVQSIKDIPNSIKTNVSHAFVFKTNAKVDLELIKRENPDLEDEQLDEIATLKKFECYAFGDFTLIDMNGNKKSNKQEPIKIVRIKPPNAQHWGGK